MTVTTQKEVPMEEIKEKASGILNDLSGLVSIKVLNIGLNKGILETMNEIDDKITAEELANKLDFDKIYLKHWLDSAYAFDYVEMEQNGDSRQYYLADHIDKLVLDSDFPAYIGGFPGLFDMDEMFGWYEENLETGDRVWWEDASHEWIKQVGSTAIPNYTRMIKKDFAQIPKLEEKLKEGANVLELASGTAKGLSKVAKAYPNSKFTGLDGDKYSIEIAEENVRKHGVDDRCEFIHSWFEDMDMKEEYDVIFINVSMHECRDIDKVTQKVYNALKSDGIFVISDISFPEEPEEYKTVPGKLMMGINFWELQIDDTLLPRDFYVDLLNKFDFNSVEAFDSTPTQCYIWGYKE